METGSYGTVTHFDGHATVRFARQIEATPNHVWTALTDEDAIAAWLAPGIVERRVAGTVRLDFGEDQQVAGSVVQYEPPRELEYTWTFTGEQDSVLRFELSVCSEGTTLVLEHRTLPPEQAVGYGAGWHAHLDMLGAFVTGTQMVDWDDRFSEVLGHYAGA